MNAGIWLPALKLIHLGALVLWLGPALGAWWLLMSANRQFGDPSPMSQHLYKTFLKIVWLEHIALGVLLLSGFLYASLAEFSLSEIAWLKYKLIVIALFVLPLEAADIWFSHVKLQRLFSKHDPLQPYTQETAALLGFYHGIFTRAALVILPPAVIAIMWLAIAKP